MERIYFIRFKIGLFLNEHSTNSIYSGGRIHPENKDEKLEYNQPNKMIPITRQIIHHIFDMYDEILFGYQIRDKLSSLNKAIKFIIVHKSVIPEKNNIILLKDDVFYIFINQLVDLKIDLSKSFIGKNERLEKNKIFKETVLKEAQMQDTNFSRLILMMENYIVELMMVLWGYLDENREICSSQGELFMCMMEKYFLNKTRIPSLKVDYVKDIDLPPPANAEKELYYIMMVDK